jgi:hypothetical protein
MSRKLAGSYFETCSCNLATRAKIDALGVQHEGKARFSTSQFLGAA